MLIKPKLEYTALLGDKIEISLRYFAIEQRISGILGFHCHAIENKIANHSVQKVQNLGNKRR